MHPNSLKNLKKYKKGESGFTGQVRDKTFVQNFCADLGISVGKLPTDLEMKRILQIVINSPLSKLESIGENDNAPAFVRLFIRDLLDDRKGFIVLSQIIDRIYGKPKQQIDAEIKTVNIDRAADDVKTIATEYALLDAAEKENKENAD